MPGPPLSKQISQKRADAAGAYAAQREWSEPEDRYTRRRKQAFKSNSNENVGGKRSSCSRLQRHMGGGSFSARVERRRSTFPNHLHG